METAATCFDEQVSVMSPIFADDAFSRLDAIDDATFYARDRFVSHLDSLALSTVSHLIGGLIVEERPAILRAGLEHGVHAALLDDRIGVLADAGVQEQLADTAWALRRDRLSPGCHATSL